MKDNKLEGKIYSNNVNNESRIKNTSSIENEILQKILEDNKMISVRK